MSVVIVKRPPRASAPAVPSGELVVEPPPELARAQPGGLMMSLAPALMGLGSMAYMFAQPSLTSILMGSMMVVSMSGFSLMSVAQRRGSNRQRLLDARRDYLRYLGTLRKDVHRTAEAQRIAQAWLHPDPEQLWSLVTGGKRLWERRPTDSDFAQIRVGIGQQRLSTPLVAPETAPVEELEPTCAEAMRRFIRSYSALPDLPMAVSLRAFHRVTVLDTPAGRTGPTSGDDARDLCRALVGQLTTFHSPDDLMVAVCVNDVTLPEWDWVKWLPHAQHPTQVDATGPVRLVADDIMALEEMLGDPVTGRPRFSRDAQPVLDQPHVVVIVDGGRTSPDAMLMHAEGIHGVTVIEINPTREVESYRGKLWITIYDGVLRLETGTGASYAGDPDRLSPAQAAALARQMAPLRVSAHDDDEPLLSNLGLTELLGVGDAGAIEVSRTWRPRPPQDRLRVPIGVGENGEPVMLDLKESALDGMGPHGLVVGATGSGKSELLRTLVLGLAVTHSSETLNFVLTDFKGGATFAGMAEMPHVAAVITNLAEELTLVDRMRDAIGGELTRRQELLRDSGNFANIHDYERARAAGAALAPLPSLLIIVDEFSELLSAKPEFIDMFIQIGRVGRSLGVHLLLASQRLEEGRLRGLDTYLSYRVGLRTFSAAESRTVLGVPDAYHLPPVPGSGYLKYDTESMVRFKAAYVSGAYRPTTQTQEGTRLGMRRPMEFTAAYTVPAEPVVESTTPVAQPVSDATALSDTVLDVIVRRLEGQGPPAHQVWLPPLTDPVGLETLLPPLTATPDRGLVPSEARGYAYLIVPVGVVDKPAEQKRDALYVDLSGSAGNVLIVGRPQSGKSTMVRALISSLALTHTPEQVQFFCLDFGGGGLTALAGLPHVSGAGTRLEGDLVRRIIAEVMGIIERREQMFRSHGIDSVRTFRDRRARGLLPEEPFGDVFLMVDGWQVLRQEFEALETEITDIGIRGLGYGVHVVITATQYGKVRSALKDTLGTRLELRLGDTMESEIDRRTAVNVPANAPGRGLTTTKLHFLGALPRIDGSNSTDDQADGTEAMVKAVAAAWRGPAAPPVRMLPTLLPAEQLPGPGQHPAGLVPIGVDESKLATVMLDFKADQHMIVFGDGESGKTGFLRLLARSLVARNSTAEVQLVIADYRRNLLDVAPEDYLLGYAAAGPAFTSLVEELRTPLEDRLPGPDVTPEQLRQGDWWHGPDIFFLVDDYDLIATSSGNPLAGLLDLLPLAKDIGLHLVITRRSGGAGRALFDPVIQRLRDLGTGGIVLSGDRDEGVLLGNVRPSTQPPGRGTFVSRRRSSELIQLAWLPDQH